MKKREQIKPIVAQWLQNPDYESGIEILKLVKPLQAKSLAINTGEANQRKLMALLCYFAQVPIPKTVTYQSPNPQVPKSPGPQVHRSQTPQVPKSNGPGKEGFFFDGKTKNQKPDPKGKETTAANQQQTAFDPEGLPPEIQKISKEHARIYQLRSQLHDKRYNIPPDNAAQNVKERKIITQSIHELSDRIEQLFNARKEFLQNKTMPDMDALFPADKPDIDPEQLRKRRTNLMKSNAKDNNMLRFQSNTRKKKPSPMPKGPKRDEIENRIAQRNHEIKQIEQLINEK